MIELDMVALNGLSRLTNPWDLEVSEVNSYMMPKDVGCSIYVAIQPGTIWRQSVEGGQ